MADTPPASQTERSYNWMSVVMDDPPLSPTRLTPLPQISHGIGPGPRAAAGTLAGAFSSGGQDDFDFTHSTGAGVWPSSPQPATPPSLPPITLYDHQSGVSIAANIPLALTAALDSAQHARLAQLLDVRPHDWVARDVIRRGAALTLEYTVADPRARTLGSMASLLQASHIKIRIDISAQPDRPQQVQTIALTGDDGHTTALPMQSIHFNAPGLPRTVLVPGDIWARQGVRGLLTEPLRTGLAKRVNNDGSQQVTWRAGVAERREVTLLLRGESVLGGWRVAEVDVGEATQPPVQLQADCRWWLQAGPHGPGLPAGLVDALRQALEQHASNGPPVACTTVQQPVATEPSTGFSLRNVPGVEYDGPVRLAAEYPRFENWKAKVYFAEHRGAWLAAKVRYSHPRLEHMDYAIVFRPDMPGWDNPFAPRNGGPESTITTASTSTTRSAQEAGLSPPPRRNAPVPPVAGGFPVVTGTGGQQATAVAPTHLPGAVVQMPFLTQQEYRNLQGPDFAGVGVCPAVAAGVALRRYVPFGDLLRVNPQARQGMSGPQTKQLLQRQGVDPQVHHFFQPTNPGMTTLDVGALLQTSMDGRTFDAAVLIYRGLPQEGSDPGRVDHHVALFNEGAQWYLHDGLAGNLPWAVNGVGVAAYTYGAREAEGLGELEMYAFRWPQANLPSVVAPAPVPVPYGHPPDYDAGPQAPQGQDADAAVRGRTLLAPVTSTRTLWNAIQHSNDATGLATALSGDANFSQPQKVDRVIQACVAHQGRIARDRFGMPNNLAYRFESVDIGGCIVDVHLCLKVPVSGNALVIEGMKILQPGASSDVFTWPVARRRVMPFCFAQGTVAKNISTNSVAKAAFAHRGTFDRWQSSGGTGWIAASIVRTCADAVKNGTIGTEWVRGVNAEFFIDRLRVPFYGVVEDFYLRFTDESRIEVADVRVKDVQRQASGEVVDELEESLIAKMAASARHGKRTRARNNEGRSINARPGA